MTIWKYGLMVETEQLVEMPEGAELLSVQVQGTVACLWARVDPTATRRNRRIFTHGTGHGVDPRAGRFIGTYQLRGGALHVFDGGEHA